MPEELNVVTKIEIEGKGPLAVATLFVGLNGTLDETPLPLGSISLAAIAIDATIQSEFEALMKRSVETILMGFAKTHGFKRQSEEPSTWIERKGELNG